MVGDNDDVEHALWIVLAEDGSNSVDDVLVAFVSWDEDDEPVEVFGFLGYMSLAEKRCHRKEEHVGNCQCDTYEK